MGSDGSIKVSDFGLSEDIYIKNYFRVDSSAPIAVPFKWMPLESLEEGICNEKTDMVRRIVISTRLRSMCTYLLPVLMSCSGHLESPAGRSSQEGRSHTLP